MEKDIAKVTFRDEGTYKVSRAKLAKNMQKRQREARDLKLRPGELFPFPTIPSNASADIMATGETMVSDYIKFNS